MLYNIHYSICALIVLLSILIFFYSKKRVIIFQNKIFGIMLWTSLISVIFDVLCGIGQSFPHKFSIEFLVYSNIGYFLFRNAVIMLFVFYAISLSGQYKNIKTITKFMIYIPYVISLFSVLITPFTGFVFYIGENHQYIRGYGVYVLYLIAFYYFMFTLSYIYIYRKATPIKTKRSVFLFIATSLTFVVVQFMLPYVLIESFGVSLSFLYMYITVQRPEDLLTTDTELLNKTAFMTMLPGSLAASKNFCVLLIIIEDFQSLRSVLGYESRSALLRDVAYFFKECAQKDMLFHITDNKFCFITKDDEKNRAQEIITRIEKRFESSWIHNSGKIRLFIKICVIECPSKAQTIDDLINCINAAEMQKKTNKIMYVDDLELNSKKRYDDIERAIKEALEYNRLEVYYQPIYSSKNKTIESAEALIRLNDPNMGFIAPDEFIPIAEQTGHIFEIGQFVLETVCKFIKTENIVEKGIKFIEINLSVVEFMQSDLAKKFISIVNKYNVDPQLINIELTETAQVYSLEIFKDNISQLTEYGFDLSLDDYGTGYSTINYMVNLPFKFVKIDKSIVWAAFETAKAADVLESVVHMIKKLNLQIVAEGIETKEQTKYILSLGCEYLQGYYFSKPVPECEFLKLIENENKTQNDIKALL